MSENIKPDKLRSIPEHHSNDADHAAVTQNQSAMLDVRLDGDGGEVRVLKAPKPLYKFGSTLTALPRPRIPLPYKISYPGPS